jgi:hypothetical protein
MILRILFMLVKCFFLKKRKDESIKGFADDRFD